LAKKAWLLCRLRLEGGAVVRVVAGHAPGVAALRPREAELTGGDLYRADLTEGVERNSVLSLGLHEASDGFIRARHLDFCFVSSLLQPEA